MNMSIHREPMKLPDVTNIEAEEKDEAINSMGGATAHYWNLEKLNKEITNNHIKLANMHNDY